MTTTDDDYTPMAAHYDQIMTSGYYDYDVIVTGLGKFLTDLRPPAKVLEIGAGTGLVLERLAARHPELQLDGIDLTKAMLDIAEQRLQPFKQVQLHLQNVVTLTLTGRYDVAFSYGGPWYFVPSGAREAAEPGYSMVSHIRSWEENRLGFERLAACLPTGGTLLLGVQGPHSSYARELSSGLVYQQDVTPISDGFRKKYSLTHAGELKMEQTTDYRVFETAEAVGMLDKCGFEYRHPETASVPMFLEFSKR